MSSTAPGPTVASCDPRRPGPAAEPPDLARATRLGHRVSATHLSPPPVHPAAWLGSLVSLPLTAGLQRTLIDGDDLDEDELWDAVEELLWIYEIDVSSADQETIQKWLSGMQDRSYRYLEDLTDELLERLNEERGTGYPLIAELQAEEPQDEGAESAGSGGFLSKLLRFAVMALAVQAVSSIPVVGAQPHGGDADAAGGSGSPGWSPVPDPFSTFLNATSAMSPVGSAPNATAMTSSGGLSGYMPPHESFFNELVTGYAMPESSLAPSPEPEGERYPQPIDLSILRDISFQGWQPNEEAGASGGGKASAMTGSGVEWGPTFAKAAEANANAGNSTARATDFNTQFLRQMGVQVPDVLHLLHGGTQMIASRGLPEKYTYFEKLGGVAKANMLANDEMMTDYAKLALVSSVADLHKKNFGLSGGKLTTIDVDTLHPFLSLWYSRGVDRMKLPEEGYKTTDVGSNYLSQGKAQDHLYHQRALKDTHVVGAYRRFAELPRETLVSMLDSYPLQGEASQRLVFGSMRAQQEMYREAFEGLETSGKTWTESEAHHRLQVTIAKYEKDHRFPYLFRVKGEGAKAELEIEVDPEYQRPKGTEVWVDEESQTKTNPALVKAVGDGHYGDAVLRLGDRTAIDPEDIPGLIRAAKKHTRSIGAGNPVVELVARLILHPSFDRLSSGALKEVQDLFESDVENGNPLRQAFFPKSQVHEKKFRSDSFYDGGKSLVRQAYAKIRR